MPVDPYVDEGYFLKLKELDNAVQSNAADIVLMGITPTYPSAKYGYIIPGGEGELRKDSLRKKPDKQTAETLVAEGALWNNGVLAVKLSHLIKLLNSRTACKSYIDVIEQYSLLEKTDSIAVVSYSGEWHDLGTWNTLTEVMDEKP